MTNTPPDELANWLDRIDVQPEDVVTIDRFREALKRNLHEGQEEVTASQVNSMYEIANATFFEGPIANIREIRFTVRGREQTRFVIPETRGLFGMKSVLDFLRGLRK